VPDQFDMTLTDPELLTELELCADLMVAANSSDTALCIETIDRILMGAPADDAESSPALGDIPPPRRYR
jgi:hypothetical protein